MLHDFPAEAPFAPQVKKPADLAGFISESSPRPRASPNVTVRRSRWRGPAVAGLCAGTGLAVALALMVPRESQSAPVSSRSNIHPAPEAPASTPVAALSQFEVASTLVKPETERVAREAPALMNPGPSATASPSLPAQPAMSVTSLAPIVRDETVIRSVLERYRGAYERLDDAGKMIGSMRFENCRIDIEGAVSVASCQGETTYNERVTDGSTRRAELRTWTFELHKNGDDWTVDSVQQSQ